MMRLELDGPGLSVSARGLWYPELLPLRDGRVAVTDQSGMLRIANWETRAVELEMYVGDHLETHAGGQGLLVCQVLGRATENPVPTGELAIPTRGGYVALVRPETGNLVRLASHSDGPVNCALYHPEGGLLVLGIGFYPLGRPRDLWEETARVEVWDVRAGEPVCLSVAAVPGVCVDCLDWAAGGAELACVSGMRPQDQGFISLLEFPALVPMGFVAIPRVWNRSVEVFEEYEGWGHAERAPTCALVTDAKRATLYSLQEGRPRWSEELSGEEPWATCDRDRVAILSDGRILDLLRGGQIGQFEPMPGCRALAFGRGGEDVWGVSANGLLCRWRPVRTA